MQIWQPLYVIYTRVSTKKQGDSGLGLEGQTKAIASYIESKGGLVVASFSDTATGTGNPLKRKGLRTALKASVEHKATLVVSHLDRLSRDYASLSTLTQQEMQIAHKRFGAFDVPPVVACCEAQDVLTTRIRAIMAEEEATAIRRRIKAALDIRKQAGDWIPGKAANDAAKARAQALAHLLPRIRAFRHHGRSWHSIADQLNSEGTLSHTGKPWNTHSLYGWFKRAPRLLASASPQPTTTN